MDKEVDRYRYKLRARITEAGYKSIVSFAKAAELPASRISRVVQGWEIPSPNFISRMADILGIDDAELEDLITGG